ncbi:MAG: discoidin domain-containing protein [Clostridia bacterium]|nr:discoidin domain-containing protein [Clostridia bacterium]
MSKENKKKLYVVSNAHLDTQWNWTVQDTIRDSIKNTMEQNFELFEKYPHYRMNFEGAFRYKLMKEYYPKMYEKVKEYVAEGRWNVSGSQWDASDANVPSSEAYMRQILYGNGYFEKEFGKKSSDIFLTDCFGFRWSLPSIAAHMGLNGFSTQKLVWGVGSPIYNEDGTARKPMPEKDQPRMDLGKWVGPDGHYVIASMLGGNYTLHFEWDKEKRPIHDREEYLKQIEHNEKWTGVPARMMYYGVGDYGGSPSDESVRYLNEAVEQNGEDKAFEVVSASTDQIMNELTPEQIANLPEYNEGLLIPHGYGALTSHTINKRWNRKSELLADSAERAASIAEWMGKASYPKDRLEEAWKLFLWHQFHDDLPGTSILDAYGFTHNDFVIAQNMLAAELTASMDVIASGLNTNVNGTPVVVYNPVSVQRTDVVTAELEVKSPYVRVFAPCGKEIPAQVTTANGKTVVKFAAKMKPVSVAVFDVQESDIPSQVETKLSVTDRMLKNERYTVTINDQGDISSVIDQANGKELLSAPCGLVVRPDNNTVWPSWELKYEDIAIEPTRVTECQSIEVYENGPASVAIKVVKTYEGSTFTQIIRLAAGSDVVEVENDVDWYCRKSMLMAEFPLTVSNEIAEFDLGLGADKGKNTNSFPYFQHCVHQWADLSDADGSYGIAVLNDCKYGMEKPNDSTLRLSLIHTPAGAFMPISAQHWQDMGKNLFRYGITAHTGDRSGVGAIAAAFNQPLMAFTTAKHDGNRNAVSFLTASNDAVIVRAVKKEEKGTRLIVRVQETAGKAWESLTLTFADEIVSAVETNGYEDTIAPASFEGNHLTFSIGANEPKTFALTLKSADQDYADQTPIALPYDVCTTSPDSDPAHGEIADGISIPEELFEEQVNCGGVRFQMGAKAGKNAVVSAGQKINLPKGAKKIAILATSKAGDKPEIFTVGDKPVTVTVQDFQSDVGAWDMIARGDTCLIKQDDIAVTYTHTHNAEGNRLYQFAYIFKYVLDVDDADFIVLPEDSDILVYSATVIEGANTNAAAALYDRLDDNHATHKLTVKSGEKVLSERIYPEGGKVLLRAAELGEQGIFERWDGDGKIIRAEEQYAIVEMGDSDITMTPVYSSIGENMILNKPCKANGQAAEDEGPEKALNGSDEDKWCTEWGKDHLCWLEVDIGDPTFIDKWIVRHAGQQEDAEWNTFDFALQYRTYENEEWKCADAVVANTDNLTYRQFNPVMARFVRLLITLPGKPSEDEQSHYARIYQFQVYKANS